MITLQYNIEKLNTEYEPTYPAKFTLQNHTICFELDDINEAIIKNAFNIAFPISGYVVKFITEDSNIIEKLHNTNLMSLGIKFSISKSNNTVVFKINEKFNSKELSSFITICINAFKIINSDVKTKIDVWKYLNKKFYLDDYGIHIDINIEKLSYEEQLMFIALSHKSLPENVGGGNYGCQIEYLQKYTGLSFDDVIAFIRKHDRFITKTRYDIYYIKNDFVRYLTTMTTRSCPELIHNKSIDVMTSISKKDRSYWLERASELA